MDQNLNPNGMMNGVPPVQPIQPTEKTASNKRVGSIIAVLAIVLLLIIGALYFFGQDAEVTPTAEDITSENVIRNDAATTNTEGTASEADAQLESDLEMQLEDVEYSF